MASIYCILDACSYIYLNKFSFLVNEKEESLFSLLKKAKFITIRHSRTIAKEIKKHKSMSNEEAMTIDNRIYRFVKYTLTNYDKALFNGTIGSTGKDKGEKENVAIAIDLFCDKKYSIIYLSDDKKGVGENGHLRDILGAFPYCQIWTSFEAVLFLYFVFNKKFFDQVKALDSIQDLVAFTFQDRRKKLVEKRDAGELNPDAFSLEVEKLNAKAQSYKINYTKKIELVRNLITN